jgi:hypothetical protein
VTSCISLNIFVAISLQHLFAASYFVLPYTDDPYNGMSGCVQVCKIPYSFAKNLIKRFLKAASNEILSQSAAIKMKDIHPTVE